MVSLGVLLLGWFLGAIPVLFVLRAVVNRHDKRMSAIASAHDKQLEAVRRQLEATMETAVQDAIDAERERATEAARLKREREPKMVAVRPY